MVPSGAVLFFGEGPSGLFRLHFGFACIAIVYKLNIPPLAVFRGSAPGRDWCDSPSTWVGFHISLLTVLVAGITAATISPFLVRDPCFSRISSVTIGYLPLPVVSKNEAFSPSIYLC